MNAGKKHEHGAGLVPVHITPTIAGEYAGRGVFGGDDEWPLVPDGAGTHHVPRSTAESMLDDAEYNGSVGRHAGQGPDQMPASIGNAYRALAAQLRKTLAEHPAPQAPTRGTFDPKHFERRGGAGRGQGRKPLEPGVESVVVPIRATPEQKAKFHALGGADWFRKVLNRAKLPKGTK